MVDEADPEKLEGRSGSFFDTVKKLQVTETVDTAEAVSCFSHVLVFPTFAVVAVYRLATSLLRGTSVSSVEIRPGSRSFERVLVARLRDLA